MITYQKAQLGGILRRFIQRAATSPFAGTKRAANAAGDVFWHGLAPKGPFNQVPAGERYYYRKIGNREGLLDLIEHGEAKQPANNSRWGDRWEGAFFSQHKPIEDYAGKYAIGYDNIDNTIDFEPIRFGHLPKSPVRLDDPLVSIYKRRPMSAGYKKLDKMNLDEELAKDNRLQYNLEKVGRPLLRLGAWGTAAYKTFKDD